jgi:pimeloyl-ACP methyl ester carboxylesterase
VCVRRFRTRIGDVITPVIEAGDDRDDEAVIFVHGNPGSNEEFAEFVERLGERRRVLAIDMPGFGRAEKPETFEHTVNGYARHLADLADAFALRRVHLVLHDFGGPWGLRFAASDPGRVASIVLINALGMPDYRWHLLARIWRRRTLGEVAMRVTNRSRFGLALRLGNPIPIPEHHIETMYANFDAATRRAVLALYRATDESELDQLARDVAEHDIPALVIWGEADPYLTLTEAQRFRRSFPSARFVRITGSGHWPHLTTPEVVEDALNGWLRTHTAV